MNQMYLFEGGQRSESGELSWLARFDAAVPEQVLRLIERGAVFVVNHSGGKDSQAMFHFVHRHVPQNQIRVVHAVLPEVEWEGVEEHIRKTIGSHPLHTCKARRTLLQMIEQRGMFPSPSNRQCTSDLKRGPIERTIRQMGNKLIVNCMGMRAQESSSRAKLSAFKYSERNSKAGREWYEWLPIHDWDVGQIFSYIEHMGQQPHWAYSKGMSRLSCCFCIMSSKADLTTAAQLNPNLYKRYVELERLTGQVMLMPSKKLGRQSLVDVTGIPT
ncbi:MAG: phosphoadenosine phosphosulfate reductase family protein [Aquabacterium sp.]